MNHTLLAVLFIATSTACAQSFTTTVITPGFVQAGAGATMQTAPLPIGPLGASAMPMFVYSGAANAGLGSTASPNSDFYVYATANGSSVAGAAADSGDWRVELSQPVLGYVALRLTGTVVASPGTVPRLEIDVGYDGTVEVDALHPYQVVGLQIGPVPTPIRIRVGGTAPPGGSVNANAMLTIVPPLATQVQRVLVGCDSNFVVATSPANDQLFISHLPCSGPCPPRFLVVGFGSQAQFLQAHPLCGLLLPTPDVVLLAPPTGTVVYIVPIPAAVRPFALWAQAVALTGPVLTTSDAYMILGQP